MLQKKEIEISVGIYHTSFYLKLYKKSWANKFPDALTASSRIFFSIWINEKTSEQKIEKIFYNIHALKLRKLDGYKIESRKFASDFRKRFIEFEQQWPNVSVQFGPLTLIEGFVIVNEKNADKEIFKLASRFLKIDFLIDDTLENFK